MVGSGGGRGLVGERLVNRRDVVKFQGRMWKVTAVGDRLLSMVRSGEVRVVPIASVVVVSTGPAPPT